MKFSIYQVTFNDKNFAIRDFDSIQSVRDLKDDRTKITDITKTNLDNERFVAIYFNIGNKFPYTPEVIDSTSKNLDSLDNPRSVEQIELTKQLFVLFDVTKRKVYLSDSSKKGFLKKWLEDALNKFITIKSSINEEQFLENLRIVEGINFTVDPSASLSSSVFKENEGDLYARIEEDIHNIEAKSASIKFSFDGSYDRIRMKERIQSILSSQQKYKDLVIAGRSDGELETIFNTEEIINKIVIEINSNKETGLFDETEVFNALIERVKNHETP